MSVESDPVPPVPEHAAPLTENQVSPAPGKMFSHPWTRWFVSIREKINVINDILAGIAALINGQGFIIIDGDEVHLRTIQGTTGDIDVADGDGVAGDPTISSAIILGTPGTYGDSLNIPVITVNEVGKVTAISEVPAAGGGGANSRITTTGDIRRTTQNDLRIT